MNAKTIFVLSFTLNVALAGAAFYVYKKPEAPAPSQESAVTGKPKKRSQNTNATAETVVIAHELSSAEEADATSEFTWRLLEARDFKVYIQNLRAVECPEETIRDIITSEVNKLYAKRIRSVRTGQQTENKYWEANRHSWNPKNYYEQQKSIRALEKERGALLVELLGVDPNEEFKKDSPYTDYWARNYQFLPEDKHDPVAEIQMKYEQQRQEIYQNSAQDEEDQKKIRELFKQQMTELAAILTPQELEEYELRASQVANQLRHDLDAFKPSEDEFRKIYAIRKAREEDLAYVYDQDDKAGRERREKAVKETDEQIKDILGERFDLYKRSPDWNYRQLVKLAERYELPRENADKVYDLKKQVEADATSIRSNKDLTSEQRKEALKNLRAEAEKSITENLGGEKAWKKYDQQQGWWLNNISQAERKKP